MKRSLGLFIALVVLASSVSAQATQLIQKGSILSWSASTGHHGSMTITTVDGLYFEVSQTNDVNPSAGVIKLYGAIVDSGRRVVLINNSQWKEIWDGSFSGSEISGKIIAGSANYSFKISATPAPAPAPAFSTAPFVAGKTLRWQTGLGQSGTVYVSSVSGTKFYLDQKNTQNTGAGVTKLEGEFKDGKVYIYNRVWNETWVGTINGGKLTGTINNSTSFAIYE